MHVTRNSQLCSNQLETKNIKFSKIFLQCYPFHCLKMKTYFKRVTEPVKRNTKCEWNDYNYMKLDCVISHHKQVRYFPYSLCSNFVFLQMQPSLGSPNILHSDDYKWSVNWSSRNKMLPQTMKSSYTESICSIWQTSLQYCSHVYCLLCILRYPMKFNICNPFLC